MTVLDPSLELSRELDAISMRLHTLEQMVTSPDLGETLGGTIVLPGPGSGSTPISTVPPSDITSVTATPGTFFDDIFVDVDWNAAVGGTATAYFDVELASKSGLIYSLISEETTGGTSYRYTALMPNQIYGVRITPVSNIGIRGETTPWTDFSTGVDGTIPPAPVGVLVGRGASSVVVSYTALTYAQAPDVAYGRGVYEVQVDTVPTFNSGNLQALRSTSTLVAFEGVDTPAGYYARVSAIDESGNQGPWSSISGPATAGGIIDSMVVAGLSAAKITFGTMSGDRITTNTLDAVSIKTSAITTADITINGGSIKLGNPPTTGVLINSQGIRAYASSVTTLVIDATTGAITLKGALTSGTSISGASITGTTITGGSIIGGTINGGAIIGTTITGTTITGGTFQTAVSGLRIVITASSAAGLMSFFLSSGAYEGFLGAGEGAIDTGASHYPTLFMASPGTKAGSPSYDGPTNAFYILKNSFGVGGVPWWPTYAGLPHPGESPCVFFVASGVEKGAYGSFTLRYAYTNADLLEIFGCLNVQYSVQANVVNSQRMNTYQIDLGRDDVNPFPYMFPAFISGVHGVGVGSLAANGTGSAWAPVFASAFTVSSAAKFKKNIANLKVDDALVDAIKPRRFRLKASPKDNSEDFGFVADELAEVFPQAVAFDADNKPLGINYHMLVPVLFDQVQKLRRRIAALEG